MEVCTYPGCGYKADFISKAHCRTVHGIEREEILKMYGKKDKIKRSTVRKSYWKLTPEIVERAARYGVSRSVLHNRSRTGWDMEMAITTPKMTSNEAGKIGALNGDWNIKRGGTK